ncbi:RibD C-terminal domain family protein [Clavispora lusitaniae]|uniref:2,5-diamino-6-ribosylamino-4(3H)-pyrimidinone 5'-phosphate reductase n=1 Tax=Clavispora lusitaniae (strain ATCC 42720) TaxID=306902 RepID=C4Y928_CLAL4|nr:uncharacterized protein CLUG_04705 [Clavispora lusitaniae ATCC 42720]EEQ40577.1 hypothetical protein CLUG_04705 [Clavispora lusitaniae ATCC 42720]KAF5209495.1 2,5-diamino-6-(ribosylamino)-4(3H)-pyrimidinone 5'-phosphate reductase [Clavispora lusitaniae]KAF7581509.1 RibD C-terminal domain family protein [Clavispora lusitaniae]
MSLIPLPESLVPFLKEYLPSQRTDRPFVTLTWAQSLDSRIAAAPGLQTKISHAETKTMTHYLRANHDSILVGIGTVLADDPKLNCRYGNSHIRPVVVDPHGKWDYSKSTLHKVCAEGKGLAPFILVGAQVSPSSENKTNLSAQGGQFITIDFSLDRSLNWQRILHVLHQKDIASVMIEGGADVINSLLKSDLVDSVIVTVGPVFLGKDGVEVSPSGGAELVQVKWWTGTKDVVMAARLQKGTS